jgi:hypothetical protein
MGITKFLKTIAPNFMWCSRQDLYLMYELIDEDADLNSFRSTLSKEVGRKTFITKQDETHSRTGRLKRLLYLRRN